MKAKVNKHHVFPSSRGYQTEDNLVYWDEKFHSLFHRVFANMTPPEQHEFLDWINEPGTHWNRRELAHLRNKIMRRTKGVRDGDF